MKWTKIIAVSAAIVILFSGVSIASYSHHYWPVFKVEFSTLTTFTFANNYLLNQEFMAERKTPIPESVKIEEIIRVQRIVNKCI